MKPVCSSMPGFPGKSDASSRSLSELSVNMSRFPIDMPSSTIERSSPPVYVGPSRTSQQNDGSPSTAIPTISNTEFSDALSKLFDSLHLSNSRALLRNPAIPHMTLSSPSTSSLLKPSEKWMLLQRRRGVYTGSNRETRAWQVRRMKALEAHHRARKGIQSSEILTARITSEACNAILECPTTSVADATMKDNRQQGEGEMPSGASNLRRRRMAGRQDLRVRTTSRGLPPECENQAEEVKTLYKTLPKSSQIPLESPTSPFAPASTCTHPMTVIPNEPHPARPQTLSEEVRALHPIRLSHLRTPSPSPARERRDLSSFASCPSPLRVSVSAEEFAQEVEEEATSSARRGSCDDEMGGLTGK